MIYCHKQSLLDQYPVLQPAEVVVDGDMGGMAEDIAREPERWDINGERIQRKVGQAKAHGGPVLIDLERTPGSVTNGMVEYLAATCRIFTDIRNALPDNPLGVYDMATKIESREQDITPERRQKIQDTDTYTRTTTMGYDWLVPECYISINGTPARHWIDGVLDRSLAMAAGRPVVPIIWAMDQATEQPATIEELAVIMLSIKDHGINDVWLWSPYLQDDSQYIEQHERIIQSFGGTQ